MPPGAPTFLGFNADAPDLVDIDRGDGAVMTVDQPTAAALGLKMPAPEPAAPSVGLADAGAALQAAPEVTEGVGQALAPLTPEGRPEDGTLVADNGGGFRSSFAQQQRERVGTQADLSQRLDAGQPERLVTSRDFDEEIARLQTMALSASRLQQPAIEERVRRVEVLRDRVQAQELQEQQRVITESSQDQVEQAARPQVSAEAMQLAAMDPDVRNATMSQMAPDQLARLAGELVTLQQMNLLPEQRAPQGGGGGGRRVTQVMNQERVAFENLTPEQQAAYQQAGQAAGQAQAESDAAFAVGQSAALESGQELLGQKAEQERELSFLQDAQQRGEQRRADEAQRRFQRLGELTEEFASMRMQPNRVFANMSTGQHFGRAIAMIVGGIGRAGIASTQGTDINAAIAADPVQQALDDVIQRDIDAQMANMDQAARGLAAEANMYERALDLMGDERAAEAATRAGLLARFERQLELTAQRGLMGQERANAVKALADIRAQRAAAQQAALEAAAGTVTTEDRRVARPGAGRGRRPAPTTDYSAIAEAVGGGEGEDERVKFPETRFLQQRVGAADALLRDIELAQRLLPRANITGTLAQAPLLGGLLQAGEDALNPDARRLGQALGRIANQRLRELSGAAATLPEYERIRQFEAMSRDSYAADIGESLRRLRELAIDMKATARSAVNNPEREFFQRNLVQFRTQGRMEDGATEDVAPTFQGDP